MMKSIKILNVTTVTCFPSEASDINAVFAKIMISVKNVREHLIMSTLLSKLKSLIKSFGITIA